MTEDHNDQNDGTTGQPVSGAEAETAPTPVPETTGEAAIALPATTPPPSDPAPCPSSPTPRRWGCPRAPRSPTGTYALGALAGNPNLGEPTGRPYAGPPTDPGAPMWAAPVAPAAPRRQRPPRPQRGPGRRGGLRPPGRRRRHRPRGLDQQQLEPVGRPLLGQHAAPVRYGERVGQPLRERLAVRRGLRQLGQLRQLRQRQLRQRQLRARPAGRARAT